MVKLICLAALATCLSVVCVDGTSSTRRGPSSPSLTDGLSYVYWRNATQRATGSVVPRPKSIEYINWPHYLQISPKKFKIDNLLDKSCISVQLAAKRYLNKFLFDDIGPEPKDDSYRGQRKRIGLLDTAELIGTPDFVCELTPHAGMDEAYNLTIIMDEHTKSYKALLRVKTNWGLLRALETFSQLIFNIRPDEGHGSGIFAINMVNIEDEPRFGHRGLLLDTARHYIPVGKILEILDAMTFNKLNVFHWHIIDDQSFPLVSESYPQLAEKSAFRPKMVYSRNDVLKIMLYAAMRGIRVVPELDSPGHTYSMRHIPNLLSECYDPLTKKKNGDFGPVDPTKSSAYEAVEVLLEEFGSLFHDSHFFAGGDEVDFDCWKSSPEINQWLDARNMSGNYTELSIIYMRRLYKMVKSHRKTMMVWQEVYDMGANLPRDVIVAVWKNINDRPAYMAQLANVVEKGYRAILSACWYLNIIDYGQDWVKFYNCDPRSAPVKKEHEHLILGGEISMWTEFVDHTNVVSRTWPRASAAAERLWSPRDANDTQEFLHRLEQQRCRLLSRGIHAEPVNGPGYC